MIVDPPASRSSLDVSIVVTVPSGRSASLVPDAAIIQGNDAMETDAVLKFFGKTESFRCYSSSCFQSQVQFIFSCPWNQR